MREVIKVEDALKWLSAAKDNSKIRVIDIHFDRDSSPMAWMHYNQRYSLQLGQNICDWLNCAIDKRAPRGCGFSKSNKRIYGSLCINQILQTNITPDDGSQFSLYFGGDCDFNFKSEGKLKKKSKIEFLADKCLKAETIKEIFSKNCDDDQSSYVIEFDDEKIEGISDQNEKDTAKLLAYCNKMHHTLLNFSLMQSCGNLQAIKQNCDNDRLDRFVYILNGYYVKQPLCLTKITRRATNRDERLYYLNQYGCIYNYCAKIYFLPTESHYTHMMENPEVQTRIQDYIAQKTNEEKAEFLSKWNNLLKSNQDLIRALIQSGEKEHLVRVEDVKNYLLLAVRFWQAKEEYFKLMDEVFQAENQQ